MTPASRKKLKNLLLQHESYRQFPYVDKSGHLTIGIGRNLDNRGISLPEAYYLVDEDILYFSNKLSHYLKFFHELSDCRQIVLVNMCFNLGIQGFLGFTQMILALEAHDYERAAQEMLDSKWALQVGDRAKELAHAMRTGKI